MKLDIALIDSSLVFTLHETGQRYVIPWEPDRVEPLCRDLLNLASRLVRGTGSTKPDFGQFEALAGVLAHRIFPGELLQVLRESSGTLKLSVDGQLQGIPWEWLHDGEEYLCHRFHIGRIQGTPAPRQDRDSETAMLVIISNPGGDLRAALSEGRELVKNLDRGGVFKARLMVNPTVEEVVRNFNLVPYVHYIGHMHEIQCENGPVPAWKLRNGSFGIPEIRACLSGVVRVRLVFSNSCPGSAADPVRSLAWPQALGQEKVPAVISTIMDLPDQSAGTVSAGFYEDLASGVPVGEALARSRERTRTLLGKHNITWLLHVLHGDPDRIFFPTQNLQDSPHRLQVRGAIPYKPPRKHPKILSWRRMELILLVLLSLLAIGLLIRPMVQPAQKWPTPPMRRTGEPFYGRILFTGFSSPASTEITGLPEAELYFIRSLTSLPGIRLQDGREPVVSSFTPFMEIGGQVVITSEETRILLLVKRVSDRVVLYADDFPLPMHDETPCQRLLDWIRRNLE